MTVAVVMMNDEQENKYGRWSSDDEANITHKINVLKLSNLKAVSTNFKHNNLVGQPTFEKATGFLVQ